MVSFSRTHRGASSSNTAHRNSVASNITTHSKHSNKAGNHNSFIFTAAKRVVSAFDHRSSWATSTSATMGSVDEKENVSPSSRLPILTSETASDSSTDKGKKSRNYGPMIQALVARFEHKDSDGSKETRDVQESPGDSMSPVVVEKEFNSESETSRNWSVASKSKSEDFNLEIELSVPQSFDSKAKPEIKVEAKTDPAEILKDVSNTESVHDVVPPLAIKHSAVRKLRSVASRMDLVKREKSVKKPKKRPESGASAKMYALDPKLAESWRAKVDALASWANESLNSGRMVSYDIPIMQHANDVVAQASENGEEFGSIDLKFGQLLTPEQDLVACFQRSSCHPHQTAYFAKILNEVSMFHNEIEIRITDTTFQALLHSKKDSSQDQKAYANEIGLTLVHHPCRVPLVFRIEAAHMLVDSLEHTNLVLNLTNETHRLWLEKVGPLESLPFHEIRPPCGGYAVKNRARCL